MSTKNNPLGDYGKLLKTLNRYSDDTRMRFLKIVDEQNIDLKDAREFILNTQKYNSNAKKVYKREKERLENEWQKGLSEKQKHDLFEEDGSRLTKRGFDIRRRYVDSRMGDLYPEKMKSIVPSTMQITRKGFTEMAETRREMSDVNYFDKRLDIYLKNYENALRRHFEDDGYFADIYNMLSKEQKIKMLQNTSGKIQYIYQEEADTFYNDFMDNVADLDLSPEQTFDIMQYNADEGGSYYTDSFENLFANKRREKGDSWVNELISIAKEKDPNIYYDIIDEIEYYDEE